MTKEYKKEKILKKEININCHRAKKNKSWDWSVRKVTDFTLDVTGSIPTKDRDLSLRHHTHSGREAHPASCSGVKWLKREVDNSLSPTATIMAEWRLVAPRDI
jgi:hypothetical protein